MRCGLCGCPVDDAWTDGEVVQCDCGIVYDDIDPEDILDGFHIVEISGDGEDGWFE